MKKKILAILIALVTLLSLGVFAVGASAADEVTVKRVVAIDDHNIVVEFSEGVALNLNGATIGPWIAIRVMDGSSLLFEGPNPCQIGGSVTFLSDGKNDRMIFTMDTNNSMGVTSIPELLNLEGDLSRFADYDIKFCIEEIHAKVGATKKDYKVENVTNLDGTVALTATTDVEQDTTYEGCYADIEFDSSYVLYPEEEEEEVVVEEPETEDSAPNNGGGSISFVETALPQTIIPSWVMPAIYALAGACVVLLAAVVLMAVKIKKLKK